MFSGIVEEAGWVVKITPGAKGIRMVVAGALVGKGTKLGDSIAVNGCCLTVVKLERPRGGKTRLHFDLLDETWRKTSFEALVEGGVVNLERALRMGDRLGGHFVTGHVDGTGIIERWEKSGADWVLEVRPPTELMRYLLYKGSIAIDGISLTVAEVFDSTIRVWIIPHTWEVTNLRERKVGDRVNLEADLLGKYVERLIAARAPSDSSPPPSSSKVRRRGRAGC